MGRWLVKLLFPNIKGKDNPAMPFAKTFGRRLKKFSVKPEKFSLSILLTFNPLTASIL